MDMPSKDPSKMTKGELLHLYRTTAAAKDKLAEKHGKASKKYKHAKQALEAGQGSNEPVEKIPYPTGQTPGRGDFNLQAMLGISKEDYNSFIASIHQAMSAAGIPTTALWKEVEVVHLADILNVVRDQHPWLGQYVNNWPATAIIKQYLKGKRNHTRRKACEAAMTAAGNAAAPGHVD